MRSPSQATKYRPRCSCANSPATPASTPARAVPAIGWLATNSPTCLSRPAWLSSPCHRSSTGCFTDPTSVSTAAGGRARSRVGSGSSRRSSGRASTTRAQSLSTEASVLTTLASRRWRARSAVTSRCTKARTSSPAACRSRPREPPISPRPTIPMGLPSSRSVSGARHSRAPERCGRSGSPGNDGGVSGSVVDIEGRGDTGPDAGQGGRRAGDRLPHRNGAPAWSIPRRPSRNGRSKHWLI